MYVLLRSEYVYIMYTSFAMYARKIGERVLRRRGIMQIFEESGRQQMADLINQASWQLSMRTYIHTYTLRI